MYCSSRVQQFWRKMSLAQLEPLRYTGCSEDTARWERITRAHALTGDRHVEDYYISSCIFLNVSASIRLMTLANIGSGLPLGPYCHPSAGTQGPLWASCKGPSQPELSGPSLRSGTGQGLSFLFSLGVLL